MNKELLPPLGIVIVDRNEALSKVLARKFTGIDRGIAVQYFAESRKATLAFTRSHMAPKMEPAVLVTDRIGTRLQGGDLVDTVRKEFPLTKILLHSRGASPGQAADLAFRDQTIDDYVSKDDPEWLLTRVSQLYDKYISQSSLSRLRAYIHRCPDPETPFFPDGAGNHLNMVEAYWEIVRQTDLGRELLVAWDSIVDDWYQPQTNETRSSHAQASRRSLCHVA